MNTLAEIEAEVQQAADQMTAEVILALIDKWENDFFIAKKRGELSVQDALHFYVRLKIAFHHLEKRANDDYGGWQHGWSSIESLNENLNKLYHKVKDARRNYYVTKRRVEGAHSSECSCRGCRCLREIPWDRANQACAIANGT